MMTKKQAEAAKQLKHTLNSNCYFPLARDVKNNIIPTTFKELFKIKHIHLPIFQRQYCWSHKVLKGFWNDLLKLTDKEKRRTPRHNIGKLFVFEMKNKILVIDGQQRITTSLILLTSIKYHLQNNLQNEKNKDIINKFIKNIDMILFNDSNNLCGDGTLKKGFNPTIINDITTFNHDSVDVLYEGQQIDFVRFLPTYLDRQSFYSTIFDHDGAKNEKNISVCNNVLHHWLKQDFKSLLDQTQILSMIRYYFGCVDIFVNNDDKDGDITMAQLEDDLDNYFDDDFDDNDGVEEKENIITEEVVIRSRKYFDEEMVKITSISKLESIYDMLLNNFTFVYLGIPERFLDRGYHIYQWTFECNLAAAKLFQIKRPGVDQRPNELFKNYILSFYVSQNDDDSMYKMYMKWIKLMKLFNNLDKFDGFLLEYINTKGYYAYDKYQDLVKYCDKHYLQNAKPEQYCHIISGYLDDLLRDAVKYLKKSGNSS